VLTILSTWERIRLTQSECKLSLPRLSEGVREPDVGAGYCTVRVTIPVAVVEPEVPVTVMV
jgi:hypothetical protein